MKHLRVLILLLFTSICLAEPQLKGTVRRRITANKYRKNRDILPICTFNTSIIEDDTLLHETVTASKYIFTGKVMTKKKAQTNNAFDSINYVYKIIIRRILKGDLDELTKKVRFAGKSFNGATVYIERVSPVEKCTPSRKMQYSAIFLAEDGSLEDIEPNYDGFNTASGLKLVVDPVPLTLYNLDRFNSAVQAYSVVLVEVNSKALEALVTSWNSSPTQSPQPDLWELNITQQ